MKTVSGKTIWIIGASSGIGRALAQELDRRGATLILSARRADALTALGAELEGDHILLPLDVADIEQVEQAAQTISAQINRIDSIVHLAAVYDPVRIDSMDIAKVRDLVNVNVMGTFHVLHAVLPILIKQGFGQLALCGSVAGFRGLPNGQPYSATKAAVINIAETLKLEHPTLDIKVINPGFVRTPLTDKNDFTMPMIIEPSDAATAIADGLVKSSFEIHFPKRFTLFIKLLRILPNASYFQLAKRLTADKSP